MSQIMRANDEYHLRQLINSNDISYDETTHEFYVHLRIRGDGLPTGTPQTGVDAAGVFNYTQTADYGGGAYARNTPIFTVTGTDLTVTPPEHRDTGYIRIAADTPQELLNAAIQMQPTFYYDDGRDVRLSAIQGARIEIENTNGADHTANVELISPLFRQLNTLIDSINQLLHVTNEFNAQFLEPWQTHADSANPDFRTRGYSYNQDPHNFAVPIEPLTGLRHAWFDHSSGPVDFSIQHRPGDESNHPVMRDMTPQQVDALTDIQRIRNEHSYLFYEPAIVEAWDRILQQNSNPKGRLNRDLKIDDFATWVQKNAAVANQTVEEYLQSHSTINENDLQRIETSKHFSEDDRDLGIHSTWDLHRFLKDLNKLMGNANNTENDSSNNPALVLGGYISQLANGVSDFFARHGFIRKHAGRSIDKNLVMDKDGNLLPLNLADPRLAALLEKIQAAEDKAMNERDHSVGRGNSLSKQIGAIYNELAHEDSDYRYFMRNFNSNLEEYRDDLDFIRQNLLEAAESTGTTLEQFTADNSDTLEIPSDDPIANNLRRALLLLDNDDDLPTGLMQARVSRIIDDIESDPSHFNSMFDVHTMGRIRTDALQGIAQQAQNVLLDMAELHLRDEANIAQQILHAVFGENFPEITTLAGAASAIARAAAENSNALIDAAKTLLERLTLLFDNLDTANHPEAATQQLLDRVAEVNNDPIGNLLDRLVANPNPGAENMNGLMADNVDGELLHNRLFMRAQLNNNAEAVIERLLEIRVTDRGRFNLLINRLEELHDQGFINDTNWNGQYVRRLRLKQKGKAKANDHPKDPVLPPDQDPDYDGPGSHGSSGSSYSSSSSSFYGRVSSSSSSSTESSHSGAVSSSNFSGNQAALDTAFDNNQVEYIRIYYSVSDNLTLGEFKSKRKIISVRSLYGLDEKQIANAVEQAILDNADKLKVSPSTADQTSGDLTIKYFIHFKSENGSARSAEIIETHKSGTYYSTDSTPNDNTLLTFGDHETSHHFSEWKAHQAYEVPSNLYRAGITDERDVDLSRFMSLPVLNKVHKEIYHDELKRSVSEPVFTFQYTEDSGRKNIFSDFEIKNTDGSEFKASRIIYSLEDLGYTDGLPLENIVSPYIGYDIYEQFVESIGKNVLVLSLFSLEQSGTSELSKFNDVLQELVYENISQAYQHGSDINTALVVFDEHDNYTYLAGKIILSEVNDLPELDFNTNNAGEQDANIVFSISDEDNTTPLFNQDMSIWDDANAITSITLTISGLVDRGPLGLVEKLLFYPDHNIPLEGNSIAALGALGQNSLSSYVGDYDLQIINPETGEYETVMINTLSSLVGENHQIVFSKTNGDALKAYEIEGVLLQLGYVNTLGANASTGDRAFTFSLEDDEGAVSSPVTQTVSVVNDTYVHASDDSFIINETQLEYFMSHTHNIFSNDNTNHANGLVITSINGVALSAQSDGQSITTAIPGLFIQIEKNGEVSLDIQRYGNFDIDFLKQNQVVNINFEYTAATTDGSQTSGANVNFQFVGTNDAPNINIILPAPDIEAGNDYAFSRFMFSIDDLDQQSQVRQLVFELQGDGALGKKLTATEGFLSNDIAYRKVSDSVLILSAANGAADAEAFYAVLDQLHYSSNHTLGSQSIRVYAVDEYNERGEAATFNVNVIENQEFQLEHHIFSMNVADNTSSFDLLANSIGHSSPHVTKINGVAVSELTVNPLVINGYRISFSNETGLMNISVVENGSLATLSEGAIRTNDITYTVQNGNQSLQSVTTLVFTGENDAPEITSLNEDRTLGITGTYWFNVNDFAFTDLDHGDTHSIVFDYDPSLVEITYYSSLNEGVAPENIADGASVSLSKLEAGHLVARSLSNTPDNKLTVNFTIVDEQGVAATEGGVINLLSSPALSLDPEPTSYPWLSEVEASDIYLSEDDPTNAGQATFSHLMDFLVGSTADTTLVDIAISQYGIFDVHFSSTSELTYDFYLDNEMVQYLNDGESVSERLWFTLENEQGDQQTITVQLNITGEDEAPEEEKRDVPAPPPENTPPQVDNDITDQTATEDAEFSFRIPENIFSDNDDDRLSYSAMLANGSDLPAWLSFNADSKTFQGRPTNENVGTLTIKVTVSDGQATVSNEFNLVVNNVNDTPLLDLNGGDTTGTGFVTGFTEATTAVVLASSDATLNDIDNAFLASVTVQINNVLDDGEESLHLNAGYHLPTGLTQTTNADGSLTFESDGTITQAKFLELIKNVTYSNVSENPNTANRTVTFTVNDGEGGTASATTTVDMTHAAREETTDSNNTIDESESTKEQIRGTDDSDFIIGNASNNIIHGSRGDDVIDGAAGNDNIYDGAGNDTLTGGEGFDVFILESLTHSGLDGDELLAASIKNNETETDVITDFSKTDMLILNNIAKDIIDVLALDDGDTSTNEIDLILRGGGVSDSTHAFWFDVTDNNDSSTTLAYKVAANDNGSRSVTTVREVVLENQSLTRDDFITMVDEGAVIFS